MVVSLAGCHSRPAIQNPDLNHYHYGKFVNLHKPRYGYGYHQSELDDLEYLKPDEIERKHYTFIHAREPAKQIDRTKNYDPSARQTQPDMPSLERPGSNIRITWLGHACFLIQFPDGTNILTDPVLGEMDGAAGFTANVLEVDTFKRVSPAVVSPSQLDFVNTVVISHNHYDHLSFNTLAELDGDVRYIVPLGDERYFSSDYKTVIPMDWYTTRNIGDVEVNFVPATHYAGRGLFDHRESLWGGYVFKSNGKSIYFAGDTGYSDVFREIHERHGDMDVCLMPISAYFFRAVHLAPEDAMQAAEDIGCRNFIPWGYGTFILGHEHVHEPLRRLEEAQKRRQPSFPIHVLKMGETWATQGGLREYSAKTEE
jgi:L-ascorbate metabolism protein UlaG (beta-lactamase superfamily)